MAKQQYVAVLERGVNDSFGVFFPDLPGCVSAGRTAEEAMNDAREALALHIEGMIEDGLAPPAPTRAHKKMKNEKNPGPKYLCVLSVS